MVAVVEGEPSVRFDLGLGHADLNLLHILGAGLIAAMAYGRGTGGQQHGQDWQHHALAPVEQVGHVLRQLPSTTRLEAVHRC